MILLFLLLGFLAAVIGAIPPGASNISVINTTVKEHLSQALKIVVGAAIAEVVLSFIALYYNLMAKTFFTDNQWLQITVAIILLCVGIVLFFKKQNKAKKEKCTTRCNSKYITGFLLGLLNPPVLIYWLFVYGIINIEVAMLTINSEYIILVLFFSGVFLGKFATLYGYGRFGILLEQKSVNVHKIINRVLGILLFSVGTFQTVNIYFT